MFGRFALRDDVKKTQAERAIMEALGCSVGQGYLFAAPMEEHQLDALLERGLPIAELRNS